MGGRGGIALFRNGKAGMTSPPLLPVLRKRKEEDMLFTTECENSTSIPQLLSALIQCTKGKGIGKSRIKWRKTRLMRAQGSGGWLCCFLARRYYCLLEWREGNGIADVLPE